ncbi:MAG TPA: thrombospondin type 3 repeat-containing protein [Acidimicrobiales bacterium]|nr:thrombospondin type 3 repeat-containing protein [Acidimicrobiales bacterium]
MTGRWIGTGGRRVRFLLVLAAVLVLGAACDYRVNVHDEGPDESLTTAVGTPLEVADELLVANDGYSYSFWEQLITGPLKPRVDVLDLVTTNDTLTWGLTEGPSPVLGSIQDGELVEDCLNTCRTAHGKVFRFGRSVSGSAGQPTVVKWFTRYTPDPGFSGLDVFHYRACSNTVCSHGTATIRVDVPDVAPVDDAGAADATGRFTVTSAQLVANDGLAVGDVSIEAPLEPTGFKLLDTTTTRGGLVFHRPGTNEVKYYAKTPLSSSAYTDTFRYQVCHAGASASCATGTVSVTVPAKAVVDAPVERVERRRSNDDDDGDGDGVPNASDNCATAPNNDQADNDGDAQGDVCDSDDDDDGEDDGDDNCPTVANSDQADTDLDLIGDACDPTPGGGGGGGGGDADIELTIQPDETFAEAMPIMFDSEGSLEAEVEVTNLDEIDHELWFDTNGDMVRDGGDLTVVIAAGDSETFTVLLSFGGPTLFGDDAAPGLAGSIATIG